MVETSLVRFGLVAVAAGTVVGLVAVLLISVPPAGLTVIAPVPTAPYAEFGGGALTLATDQVVTVQAQYYSYCGAANPECTVPIGVAYVSSVHVVALTQQRTGPGGLQGGIDAVTFFDPATFRTDATVTLGCAPGIPFYPGAGMDVFVPCTNATPPGWTGVEVVNVESGLVVANLSIPLSVYYATLTYDPLNGLIYVVTDQGALVEIDPVNDTVAGALTVTGAAWQVFPFHDTVAFDSATGDLIAPASGGGLLAIDPVTGATLRTLPLPAHIVAVAVDPASHWIAASSAFNSSVAIYNATTYRLEANLSIPDQGEVQQVLFDPANGDAYLLSFGEPFTLNLSAMSLISSPAPWVFGFSWSAIYVPSTGRIFGTYMPGELQPGYMIRLTHSDRTVVTRLAWMPTAPAILVLAAATGSVLAAGRAWRSRRAPP